MEKKKKKGFKFYLVLFIFIGILCFAVATALAMYIDTQNTELTVDAVKEAMEVENFKWYFGGSFLVVLCLLLLMFVFHDFSE